MKLKLIDQKTTLLADTDAPQYIFISDIHGNLDTLSLIKQAQRDYPAAQLVCGGDYVDGRPHVQEVLDFLKKEQDQGAIILMGNHEQMLCNYAQNTEWERGIWFYNGGQKSLVSMLGKVATPEELRKSADYQFIRQLPIMLETPRFVFVHGGVRPDKQYNVRSSYPATTNIASNEFDYDFYRFWARSEYWYKHSFLHIFAHNHTGKTIVTGHTPTCEITGRMANGKILKATPWEECPVRVVQYKGEPARIFTDGGSHSNPKLFPNNAGNVVVLNQDGAIEKIYRKQDQVK